MSLTHIMLVSDQAAANLLPALDSAIKPKHVLMLVSGKMEDRAKTLAQVLKENAISVEILNLPDENDFSGLSEQLLKAALPASEAGEVWLNATGGTKLMAMSAQQVALAAGWPVFYIDASSGRIVFLPDVRGQVYQPARQLEQRLKLKHYLQSYGYTLKSRDAPQPTPAQREVIMQLVVNVEELEKGLGYLNSLAQVCESRRCLDVSLDEHIRDSLAFQSLAAILKREKMIEIESNTLRFADDETRRFLNGGWVEIHVFATLAQLRERLGIRDLAANAVVEQNGTRNEFDALFMASNRIYAVECKTANMQRDGGAKANDALFKLAENSRRIGGLNTQKMLVSYRNLSDTEKRLAALLGIKLASGKELARLSEKVLEWVAPQ